ncbi:RhuM family protein [Gluconobacter frateurii]|uniref:Virulence protein n=1 Tax=Gluconobacter frateurii NRIC 0228 TaxID=1307946 RepID=A0ABQ0QE72_9PROT|nr:RhuM family protein [Gluconobacter frateurii]GBR15410.1 virulence protein [Gluconobacter frateurii NRIC 0228]GLP90301.1 hypothetical protein GCM10007868_13760 [Gluconobacter frateurii]
MAKDISKIPDEKQEELILAHYETPECSTDFHIGEGGETVWATQSQIAEAFEVSVRNVSEHLQNIFRDGELEEGSVVRKFRITAKDGKNYNTLHYNLDAILSVGYRVSGPKATAFRKWATQVLKSYITQGFALDESRLRHDPNALQELAAKVRELRSDEQNIYRSVRDVFAFGSSDYDSKSPIVRSFYARLQDKFLYAITGQTAAQVILERADAKAPNMGLTSFSGNKIRKLDINTGKNYLQKDELYLLHILCEQFLLFVESSALRGKKLKMSELDRKFDELLRVQDQKVLTTYDGFFKGRATQHAEREWARWQAERLTR